MLTRLYVHNYRCLENFDLPLGEAPSSLLIGGNGSGKSTIRRALGVFQRIARGSNRVRQLVVPDEFTRGQTERPMRFELQARLGGVDYRYAFALELPAGFRELRVLEESLYADAEPVYMRERATVTLVAAPGRRDRSQFNIDWHLLALPVIQDPSISDPLRDFRQWMARFVLLSPIPSAMSGDSTEETLEPSDDASNFADWLVGLLAQYPAAYSTISDSVREVMPDLDAFRNLGVGRDTKLLRVRFLSQQATFEQSFDDLSDGEKCYFLSAVLLAANKEYGPLFAFWDEPDAHLTISEVGQFVVALRRGFQRQGQLVLTSHDEETINSFSSDNTWFFSRHSHLDPTVVRRLSELPDQDRITQAMRLGEVAR